MNEHKRNEVIAKHEDNALNKFLDDRDEETCEKCMERPPYIEHNFQFICQHCYEDACERAEYLVDCQEDM